MSSSAGRDQASDAKHLYDERAVHYDDSWHPRFARHIVELAKLRPGEHVLDLACGTGLVSYLASEAVGFSGSVTGVDISNGMLAQAREKKTRRAGANVDFYQHSITELASLPAVAGRKFDAITCASALVLLEHPADALKEWTSYLKSGGRLLTDVTHPQSQISFITLERVGHTLGRPLPFYRTPFRHPDDLRTIMEAAGLKDIEMKIISQNTISGTEDLKDYVTDLYNPRIEHVFEIEDADRLFEKYVTGWSASNLASEHIRDKARQLFREEWKKLADAQGKIKEVDAVFVGIGFKP